MKHSNIKLFFAAAFIFAISSMQKTEAQFFMFWNGDSRLGITAGLNHNFKPFSLQVPTGYTLDGEATTAMLTPSIGFYSGMEQDINQNLSFGFDGRAFYNKLITNATLKDAVGTTYDYRFTAHSIAITENVYLAYEIMDETQADLGVGIYERLLFGGKAESLSTAENAPACGYEDMSFFTWDFGIDVSAGLTHYFGDAFFVKGSLDALIPLFTSGKFFESFSSGWNSSKESKLTAFMDCGLNLGFNVIVGFRW